MTDKTPIEKAAELIYAGFDELRTEPVEVEQIVINQIERLIQHEFKAIQKKSVDRNKRMPLGDLHAESQYVRGYNDCRRAVGLRDEEETK